MLRKSIVAAAAGLLLATALGCAKSRKEKAPALFRVVSTTPANGRKSVAVDAQIAITFSQSVDTATLAGNYTFEDVGGNPVTVVESWANGNTVLVLAPSANLAADTKYIVTLTSGVTSTTGLSLERRSFSFTTGAGAATALDVLWTGPPNAVNDVPLNKRLPVSVCFSETMNTATVTAGVSFIVEGKTQGAVTGSLSWSSTLSLDDTVTFTPSVDLNAGERYTVRITTACQSSAGHTLAEEYEFWFVSASLAPTAAWVAETTDNPAHYINATTETGVTVRLRLPDGVRKGDAIWVRLTDAAAAWVETTAGVAGSGERDISGLDASGLQDGVVTIEAATERYGVRSDVLTGDPATKDTVSPSTSLDWPSVVPSHLPVAALTLKIDCSEAGTLTAEARDGTATSTQTTATAAGVVTVSVPLHIAAENTITLTFVDSAGNAQVAPLTWNVWHRGGYHKVDGSTELKVWVYDWHTYEPIQNAIVVLGDTDQYATTDAEGFASFGPVGDGRTVTVYYPPALGHARYGTSIFTVFGVDPGRLSVPLGFDAGSGGSSVLADLSGNTSQNLPNGFITSSDAQDWPDNDLSDGTYQGLFMPSRFLCVSVFDISGQSLVGHGFAHLEPLAPAGTGTADITVTSSAPTSLSTGNLTVPADCMLPESTQDTETSMTAVVAVLPNTPSLALAGVGWFPADPSGTQFAYSTSDIQYYEWPDAQKYGVGVVVNDVFGREFHAFSYSTSAPGGAAPDLTLLDPPEITSPANGAVPTPDDVRFSISDVVSQGLYLVETTDPQTEETWMCLFCAPTTTVTLPRLTLTGNDAPPQIVSAGRRLVAKASASAPDVFDPNSYSVTESFFLSGRYATSKPVALFVADTTLNDFPGAEVTGAALNDSDLTVKVIDMITRQPVQNAIVYIGNYNATTAVLTDAAGTAVLHNVTGPVTLTAVGPAGGSYSYMTIFDLNASYVVMGLRDFVTSYPEFTLWGDVYGMTTANTGAAYVPGTSCYNFNINHYHPTNPGLNEPDPLGTHSVDGLPENYSSQMYQAAAGVENVVTAFDENGATSDEVFTNFTMTRGAMNPSSGALQWDLSFPSPAWQDIWTPIKPSSSPSTVTAPGGHTLDDGDAYLHAFSLELPTACTPLVGYGRGTLGAGNASYTYGLTYARPSGFETTWYNLKLDGSGTYGAGDAWYSYFCLGRLIALPSACDAALPTPPRIQYPTPGAALSQPPSNLVWNNSFPGKPGVYHLMVTGQGTGTPPPFFAWMLVKPTPASGSQVQVYFPSLPPSHTGPSIGMNYSLTVTGIHVAHFDKDCWFMPLTAGFEEPGDFFIDEMAQNTAVFTVP